MKPTPPADAKAPAKPAKKAPHAKPKGPAVNVRMYKLPLGDCFLLTFPKDGGGEFRMLIDCGLVQGAQEPEALMTRVAADLKGQADRLDLVLITHEHWDHVSGFSQARDLFGKIAFERLWLAWTEKPDDEQAQRLRAGRESRHQLLLQAVQHFQGAAASPAVELAQQVLAFTGGLPAAGGGGTAEALRWVKGHAGAANTTYCEPGTVLDLPGVSARVYVLGPPRDEGLIRRSTPSISHPETYLAPAEEQLRMALQAAAAGGPALAQPFDEAFRVKREEAEAMPFFREHYGFGQEGAAWRRVNSDWQGLVGPLALQLDSDTNNTSLAIAIELLPSRRVLLFPGDAQVGNWLSWHSLSWPGEGGGPKVTARDLLARTVLYKVGHHGSHNATLREQGLELMTAEGLLAMVPVDATFANETKHWQMPWPDLSARLLERTGGRILHAGQAPAELGYATVTDLAIDVPVPL